MNNQQHALLKSLETTRDNLAKEVERLSQSIDKLREQWGQGPRTFAATLPIRQSILVILNHAQANQPKMSFEELYLTYRNGGGDANQADFHSVLSRLVSEDYVAVDAKTRWLSATGKFV